MQILSLRRDSLAEQLRVELRRRGYYVMDSDELELVWTGYTSTSARAAVLGEFASQLGATVAGWHEGSAFLRSAR